MRVSTLSELIQRLRDDSGDMERAEVFAFLQGLIGPNIKARCENSIDDCEYTRVLLTSNRQYADFSIPLTRQCNGVVLQYPSWSVLSMPASMFNPKNNIGKISSQIEDFDIYDIKDGTTVTLYWYIDSWRMSSTNGFDVGEYQWMGPSTYTTAFNDVMQAYPDFTCDALDKQRSYTIGFRHPEFHPLRTDHPHAWFIQSYDLTTGGDGDASLSDDIGLPLQYRITVPRLSTRALQRWFTERNVGALARYITSADDNRPDIHYGFVFRSKTGQSDTMVESDLLRTIRSLMYNLPKRQHQTAPLVTAANRLEYTILRTYLTPCPVFLKLFPQFEVQYRSYSEFVDKLKANIISLLRSHKGSRSCATPLDRLATLLADHIRAHIQVNVTNADGPSVIHDFLMQRQHLDIYHAYLSAAN